VCIGACSGFVVSCECAAECSGIRGHGAGFVIEQESGSSLAQARADCAWKEKNLRASGITVQAHSGDILLEGWVPEASQIDQAVRVAQGVPGVISVRNALTLSTF
jgi:hyperosmotically inducible periplasmic protein